MRAHLALMLVAGLASCAPSTTSRILNPKAAGMICPDAGICIDDTARLAEARALRAEAAGYVQRVTGRFQRQPRVLFCSTPRCSAQFGLQGPKGANLGTQGIVISHLGWNRYTVRHEMIHHRQNEVFGVAQASNALPKWFIEGAAYSLSGDPRRPLPNVRNEGWRKRFEAWQAAGNRWDQPPQ